VPIDVKDPVKLLRAVPLFSACTTPEIRVLLKIAHLRKIDSGTVLVDEDAHDETFYAIVDGDVRVAKGRRTLARFGPGDFVGELAVLDPGPRTATVTATSDLTVYTIDGPALRDLLLEAPEISVKLLQGLARRLRETDKSIKD
jgi:CRP/FNR family transcriptional regulator, cyclic AMP receptor protein